MVLTPLFEYYLEQQKHYDEKYTNSIVFMQVGSFYEVYSVYDKETSSRIGKSEIVSKILNFRHSTRNDEVDCCGFPMYSYKSHINLIIDNGYTAILLDEEDSGNKKVRNVNCIYSPGTLATRQESNILLSIHVSNIKHSLKIGISTIDVNSGVTRLFQVCNVEDAYRIIESVNPMEIIINFQNVNQTQKDDLTQNLALSKKVCHFSFGFHSDIVNSEYQNEILSKLFGTSLVERIDEFQCYEIGLISFLILVQFCHEHNENLLKSIHIPIFEVEGLQLILHHTAIHQLNVVNTHNHPVGSKSIHSLYDVVNNTSTPMGKRKLREILANPTANVKELKRSYTKIEEMLPKIEFYEKHLRHITDIERIHHKIVLNTIQPFELANLQESYNAIKIIMNSIESDLYNDFTEYLTYFHKTYNVLKLDVSLSDLQQTIFQSGFSEQIDKLQDSITTNIKLADDECLKLSKYANQKKKKQEDSQVVHFEGNKKCGYIFHTTYTRSELIKKYIMENNMKCDYTFHKESKTKVTISSTKINNIIHTLVKSQDELKPIVIEKFTETVEHIKSSYSSILLKVNTLITEIDVIKSKAKTAILHNYCKPKIVDSERSFIKATGVRHPIIELIETHNSTSYIPNDINIGTDNDGILLYGVNGSGKSCYMKSVGLAIILAQSGHFVPCDHFEYSPYTTLFTRINCDDNIFKGQSSFFVEMSELKSILNICNSKSLILGDEVCKGTEDVSALAIVASSIEHFLDMQSSFIFATHLHKLPEISIIKNREKLKLMHMSVECDKSDGVLQFTRKLEEGLSEKIYGLEIANYIIDIPDFFRKAYLIRNEIINKPKKVVDSKKSKYSSKVFMDSCHICGASGKDAKLEAHHIIFQSDTTSKVKKNNKGNLVVLCNEHHNQVHSGKLLIGGWKNTTEGRKLEYEVQ